MYYVKELDENHTHQEPLVLEISRCGSSLSIQKPKTNLGLRD